MELMLQTTDLCKSFKKQKVVNHVSLNIEKGKVYGLLGPNGAGKSTTLKMLTGILKPTAGEIYFGGKPWNRECLSRIGALIENPPVYGNLSARENLKVRSLLLGVDEKRIEEVLQMVSLTDTGKKRAGQFSLGMKQRLGIAMALLGKPELLILDEWLLLKPTDSEQRDIFELLHRRRKKSSTIFCSQYEFEEWYDQLGGDDSPLADAIIDRIAHDSYRINITSINAEHDISMREVYGLDKMLRE